MLAYTFELGHLGNPCTQVILLCFKHGCCLHKVWSAVVQKLLKVKVTDKFSFPLSMDFGPYQSPGSKAEDAGGQLYDLQAILIHKGSSASQGHYGKQLSVMTQATCNLATQEYVDLCLTLCMYSISAQSEPKLRSDRLLLWLLSIEGMLPVILMLQVRKQIK